MILFYDNSMHYEDSIICMIVLYDTSDEDLELSGAPHPYTYNTRKKNTEKFEFFFGILGYQTWVPDALPSEIW